MRKRLVYVSSTAVDLEQHRTALKAALEKAQYDVACMEKYAAFDERPLDKCRADVARCDVFVLLVAHRYGFRPDAGNPGGKSITELEYDEAGRHAGKPRLVFTVDPEHPWNPKWIDKGDDAAAVDAFKQAVERRHGVNRFADPDHLTSLVLQALHAAESGDAPATDVGAARWNWPRPWDFSGYLLAKRRNFVGREWLFDEVRTWYRDGVGLQALMICADFGVGKSAFMAELAAGAHGVPVTAYHFCHHDTIETLNPATFVRSVAAHLAAALPAYRSAVEADPDARRWLDEAQLDPASAFERAVVAPLNAIEPPAAPAVLLVDALDEALDFEVTAGSRRAVTIVRLLAARAARLPPWLKVLGTSRRRQDVLQPMREAFRLRTLDGEDDRNLADIGAYVATRCAGGALHELITKAGSSVASIATFLSRAAQSGGKFLYAVRVLNDVQSGALPLRRLEDLPPGMDAFYLEAFEHRFPSEGAYAPVRTLLAVLCAKREPMSRAELAGVLRTGEGDVRAMLARIEDFLTVRARRFAFDHLSLAQWLVEENAEGFPRAGRFVVDAQAAQGLIADWARGELAAGRAHASEYLARHLGACLEADERQRWFPQLLLDERWLGARLRAAGADALLGDWEDVAVTPALGALERALRHASHVLGYEGADWHGPDFLASQIVGRLQHRTEPELRALCAQAAEELRRTSGVVPLTPSLRSSEAVLRTLEGQAQVSALAVLADGRLASGSREHGAIKLWNPDSGACEALLEGHAGPVFALAVLPDGRLASGSADRTVKIWTPATGGCEATLVGHTDSVAALTVLADGRLASGSRDATIKLWQLAGGACESTLAGHAGAVSALAALPDGRLVSAARDTVLKLWNPAKRTCEATLEPRAGQVSALVLLADGWLALGSWDHTIKLWHPEGGIREAVLPGHAGPVFALARLADGRLAVGSRDNTIKLWNPTTGASEASLVGHAGWISELVVLRDGRLASGSWDGTIKLWNVAAGACEATFDAHAGSVFALAARADGRLASGSWDRTVKLWNPARGACEATFKAHAGAVSALAWLADGRLATASWDKTIKVWSVAGDTCEALLEGHGSSVSALAPLGDGRLASASRDNKIKIWRPASGDCEATLKGHAAWVSALAVLADGRIASGSRDGASIKLWDPASGARAAVLKGHSGAVCALAALADGRLASGSSDGTISIWNTATGACEATLEGHAGPVAALAALAEGWLASGSSDKTLRVWQTSGGRSSGEARFIADATIHALAWVAGVSVLAAGDAAGRVHFLAAPFGRRGYLQDRRS